MLLILSFEFLFYQQKLMTQLQYISLILLALYFVGIMVVVLRAKKSTSAEDYFLAGRQLPFWALSITFIASWWGGGSAIDLVDHGFNQGISSFWIYGMYFFLPF